MLHSLLSSSTLAFIELDFRHLVVFVIPMAGIALGGVLGVSGMYFQNRRRQMWHDTARIALEKGQPLPAMDAEGERVPHRMGAHGNRNDVRSGFVLVGVGGGLATFFYLIGAQQLVGIGAIPGFIGVALLLYSIFAAIFQPKTPAPGDRPSQS